jgi:hypothetical protein
MKNQKEIQPAPAHQIKGEGIAQGPAGRHPLEDQEWSDGNGY